jgi:hypothetical protein
MSLTQRLVAAAGVGLIVVGVTFIFWPAGLIVAGVALVTAGLTDFKE